MKNKGLSIIVAGVIKSLYNYSLSIADVSEKHPFVLKPIKNLRQQPINVSLCVEFVYIFSLFSTPNHYQGISL